MGKKEISFFKKSGSIKSNGSSSNNNNNLSPDSEPRIKSKFFSKVKKLVGRPSMILNSKFGRKQSLFANNKKLTVLNSIINIMNDDKNKNNKNPSEHS
jgi:hypothetical protein